MSRWKFSSVLTLAAALAALGCGSKSSSAGVSVSISPTTASVITNRTQPFSALVSGSSNTQVTWSVTCATNVTANTCGSIDSTGLFSAPATIPTVTSNGTTTIAPTVTITATSQADTTKRATATLTIVTGIGIAITPATATVGTNEHFTFSATVSNPGCNINSNPNCLNVTWSVPTSTTSPNPNGSIDKNSGVYTAPGSAISSVVITATSVADTSVTATATVTVVTATTPTVTSVSPNIAPQGGLFQDIYITGTNFISTDNVYVNGAQLNPGAVSQVSSSVIRARLPDFVLAAPPASNILQMSVSEQTGAPQTCPTATLSLCQVTVTGVQPGVIGPSPISVAEQSQPGGVLSFSVDGGFFGTPENPAVTTTYDGQLRPAQVQSTNSTRQLLITIGGSSNPTDLGLPGLHPVAVRSATDSSKLAMTNLAVQPTYGITAVASPVPVGSKPSDVAIDPATGIAVVANAGSESISLINLATGAPVGAAICTGGPPASGTCPPAGPTSVAIYYTSKINLAVVVNSTSKSLAVVDLASQQLLSVTPLPMEVPPVGTSTPGLPGTPEAVAVNPVTGQGLVVMQHRNYGVLFDLTQSPPKLGVVSISTGSNTKVAVEPHLNWAVATPGGAGSVAIVDLNRQTCNPIATLSRTSNVVQVTVSTASACPPSTSSPPPLAVQLNDAVLIQNASDASYDGIFMVTAIGPASNQFSYTQTGASQPNGTATGGTVNYSEPVATPSVSLGVQGIGINTETQQAVLVDPTAGGVVTFLSLIDQSSNSLTLLTNKTAESGTTAAAYNPLTNTVVAVNAFTNTLSVIDPTTPRRLNDNNLGDYVNAAHCASSCGPVAVAVDPATNTAVVVNQGDNSVSILTLNATGNSIRPISIVETSPKTVMIHSALNNPPSPSSVTLTIIGKGLACNGGSGPVVLLDNNAIQPDCASSTDRVLTATVRPALLTSPHRYALQVMDANGNVTNAEDFTVEQSVDLSTACTVAPQPAGVAIDPYQNIAAVTLFGCNSVALINLASGPASGTGTLVAVGTNPIGVAMLPRSSLAVVANNGSANASIVDELHASVKNTVSTATGSQGAAADDATGEVAIANSVANTVTVVNTVNSGGHSISTGSQPRAVGFNYVNHQIGVASTGSSTFGTSDASGSSLSTSFGVNFPTSVAYDPAPADCGQNGTSSSQVGCFLVNSSTNNIVDVIDPATSSQTSFRLGINPTAIAYNYFTGTLVSTNTASRTMTVADFLGHQIRAVLPLPAPANAFLGLSGVPQFALDLHPFSNLAVVADMANGQVLILPLPR
jgi:hypothetical protein